MAAVLLLLLFHLRLLAVAYSQPETEVSALLTFKESLNSSSSGGTLSAWSNSSGPPCGTSESQPWPGVVCYAGHVSAVHLNSQQISGKLGVAGSLDKLPGLRVLMLRHNSFSGELPDLSRLVGLRALYLSGNKFSGGIQKNAFATMTRLKKLYLENNEFSGELPESLAAAKTLIEVRLEINMFSGQILDLKSGPRLKSFNISGNKLTGPIPKSLAKFDASAFAGNEKLCGPPLVSSCHPESAAVIQPQQQQEQTQSTPMAIKPGPQEEPSKAKAAWSLAGIMLASLAVMGVAVLLKRQRSEGLTLGKHNGGLDHAAGKRRAAGGSKVQGGTTGRGIQTTGAAAAQKQQKQIGNGGEGGEQVQRTGGGTGAGAELIMVNEAKGVFGASDLMNAAAEVLGSGGLGSAYKAVMTGGAAVAVKRLRDMNRVGRETFDVEMRRLGRLRHLNVLPPLAYHYRKDEKLLVYEFVPKGSLLYILHGDRGPDHAALNWITRLKIIRGIAAGMVYLHTELDSNDVPHGNLKSGNVLLADDFTPLLADYGYVPLVNPSQASATLFAYRSPEALAHRHVSPKSDVYCLGIVILEILTGKFPSQYLNSRKGGTDIAHWVTTTVDENRDLVDLLDPTVVAGARWAIPHMEQLLRIGAACVENDLERRPSMRHAAGEVEEAAEEADRAAATANVTAPTLKDGCAAAASDRRAAGDVVAFAIS